jgi:hypothetical protein
MDWNEAETYLSQLEERNQPRISQRLKPFLIGLSLAAFIAGLAMGYAYYDDVSRVTRLALGRNAGLTEFFAYTFLLTYDLPLLIGGVTLAAGGALGLIRTLFKTISAGS